MSKQSYMNANDRRTAEWGEQRQLKMLDWPYGNAESPRALLDKGQFEPQLRELERASDSLSTFFDHARFFVLPPARKRAGVMHTSMYRGNIQARYQDDATFARAVRDIAERFGIDARVGAATDVTYHSDNPGPPTVPIVWWNPARINLNQLESTLHD